jgi:putative ABC transport system substrate-binding protein
MMRRRQVIAGLGSVAVASAVRPRALRAQQALPVIGYIGGSLEQGTSQRQRADFSRGLTQAGYTVGRNIEIEYRWVESHNERLPALLGDLIGRRVAVLAVVDSTAAALAAKAATQTIPIVFRIGGDPIASGLVASLSRPGGNITGITSLGGPLGAKRLDVLHELLPAGATVVLLVNPTNANAARETDAIQAAARTLGLRLQVLHVRKPDDFDMAFDNIGGQEIGGLLTTAAPLFFQARDRLVGLVARRAVPAVYSDRFFLEGGGLVSYGPRTEEAFFQVGVYTGRILKGEKPGELPVQQITKVELGLNLKTAKTLGITLPPSLLGRADEVIE